MSAASEGVLEVHNRTKLRPKTKKQHHKILDKLAAINMLKSNICEVRTSKPAVRLSKVPYLPLPSLKVNYCTLFCSECYNLLLNLHTYSTTGSLGILDWKCALLTEVFFTFSAVQYCSELDVADCLCLCAMQVTM